jgi:hypothetical protein
MIRMLDRIRGEDLFPSGFLISVKLDENQRK